MYSVKDAGRLRYVQNISVGPHLFQADEPVGSGGNDAGPDPYELTLGRPWEHAPALLSECMPSGKTGLFRECTLACHTRESMLRIVLSAIPKSGWSTRLKSKSPSWGDLSDDQQRRLMEIANKCPVHRTLSSQVQIRARQSVGNPPPR